MSKPQTKPRSRGGFAIMREIGVIDNKPAYTLLVGGLPDMRACHKWIREAENAAELDGERLHCIQMKNSATIRATTAVIVEME